MASLYKNFNKANKDWAQFQKVQNFKNHSDQNYRNKSSCILRRKKQKDLIAFWYLKITFAIFSNFNKKMKKVKMWSKHGCQA